MTLLYIVVVLFVGCVTGLLGAYGGAKGTSKNWRRVGIPVFLFYIIGGATQSWIIPLISSILLYIATTLPYGIPSVTDSGGEIGRFFYLMTHNIITTDIYTRLTVGLAYSSICLTSLILGNFPIAFLCIIGITANTVWWGAIAGNFRPIIIDIFGWKPYINTTEFLIWFGVGALSVVGLCVG